MLLATSILTTLATVPRVAVAAVGSEEPAPPGTSQTVAPPANDLTALAAQAAEDLRRGSESFFKKQGPRRIEDAVAALSSAIDALAPFVDELDPVARRTLATALDYRAQCHSLQGEESEAEGDFTQLIAADPGYAPDSATTSRKIVDRFRKVQSARLAWVTVQADPQDAAIVWNGRAMATAVTTEVPVLAGPFVLKAIRACYGPVSIEGTLAAGEKKVVPVRLDPVARAVRFETSPAGFEIEFDGTLAGRTSPANGRGDEDPSATRTGLLEIACVTAGEHAYVLRKNCYEEAKGTVAVEIDFANPSPILVPAISPARKEVRLSVASDVPGASILIDGEPAGTVPLDDRALCPGRKTIELRAADRLVWAGVIALEGTGPVRLLARARPALRLIFPPPETRDPATQRISEPLSIVRQRASTLVTVNLVRAAGPAEDAALSEILARPGVEGPELRARARADLVLAVDAVETEPGPSLRLRLTPASAGGTDLTETTLCAPPIGPCVERFFQSLDEPWPRLRPLTGLRVTARPGQAGLIVIAARDPAAAAGLLEGDRLLEAAGTSLSDEASFRVAVERALGDKEHTSIPILVERGGARRELALELRLAPAVAPPAGAPVPNARILAAAEFESSVLPSGESRNAALLNLASVLIGLGDTHRALALALEREGWAPGLAGAAAQGTARFLAGRCYEALGDTARALEAYQGAAKDAGASFWDPDGLPVAPLARLEILASTAVKSK